TARKEHLVHLVEQTRGRHRIEHPRELRNRRERIGMNRETELRGETNRAQDAHRIFSIARLRIADQTQHACTSIFDASDVIPNREIADVVVEGIRCEISPPYVLFDRAVEIVAQDAPALIEDAKPRLVDAIVHVNRRVRRSESRHFDDLVTEAHVRQVKATTDQAAIPEELFDLIRMRVRGDVEVLWASSEQ